MKTSTTIAVAGVTVAVVAAAVIVGVSVGGSDNTSSSNDEFQQFCSEYGLSFSSETEYNFRKDQYEMVASEI